MSTAPEIRHLAPREVDRIGRDARRALGRDPDDAEALLRLRFVETLRLALEAAGDRRDAIAIREDRREGGPAMTLDQFRRIAAGENPLRVWRQTIGMKAKALAAAAGISAGYLSDIERDRQTGSLAALQRLAGVLDLDLENIVRPASDEAAEG